MNFEAQAARAAELEKKQRKFDQTLTDERARTEETCEQRDTALCEYATKVCDGFFVSPSWTDCALVWSCVGLPFCVLVLARVQNPSGVCNSTMGAVPTEFQVDKLTSFL